MKKSKKASLTHAIAIVTRNRPQTLRKCIHYLIKCSILPDQIVIVDASDKQDKTILQWLQKNLRKKKIELVYRHILHFSVSHSRNLTLDLVTTDLISFLDDDEFVPPHWIEDIQKVFTQNKKIECFWGPNLPSTPTNFWHQVWLCSLEFDWQNTSPDMLPPIGNSHYRTAFLQRHNIHFDCRFHTAEDKVFSLQVKKHTQIPFYQKVWVTHEYRHTFKGFARQWFGYGPGLFLLNHLYFFPRRTKRQSLRPHLHAVFSTLRFLRQSYQSEHVKKNPVLVFGLFVRDLSFTVGYLVGLLKYVLTSSELCVLFLSTNEFPPLIDGILRNARELGKTRPVLYLSYERVYTPVKLRQLFQQRQAVQVIHVFTKMMLNRFTQWPLWFVIPFARFKPIEQFNIFLNLLFIRLFFQRHRQLIVIAEHPHLLVKKFIRQLHPYFVISDCTDIWNPEAVALAHSYSHLILTNSQPLYELNAQYGPTKYISAGYFSEQQIQRLHLKRNKKTTRPTVLFIGTITWRLDFDLLLFLIRKLPHYTFSFYSTELFAYNFMHLSKEDQHLYTSAQRKWQHILQQPNMAYTPVKNHDELVKQQIQADVGIITLNMQHEFNQYAHPIKIYEYFALGLPVVSNIIPSITHLASQYVHFAHDKQHFLSSIKKLSAMKVPTDIRRSMYNEALSQTFENKAQTIHDLLQELEPFTQKSI